MKALVICPGERAEVAQLAENAPLVVAPLLGRSVIEYWLEEFVGRGVNQVIVLASDRPHQVRAVVGNGARWGLTLEVLPQRREFSVDEARRRYRPLDEPGWLPGDDVTLLDHLPGDAGDMFGSYERWFSAVQAFTPRAASPARIGTREVQPGVWVGLHVQIDRTARIHPPCWIGDDTVVGAGVTLGPGAFLDERVIVETGARITQSVIGPDTFVGELISVENSLAHGDTLVNWKSGSCLRVPDSFLLSSLNRRHRTTNGSSVTGRMLAVAAMISTAPVALAMMTWSLVRGESLMTRRIAVRPQCDSRKAPPKSFVYYELAGSRSWLHRWPQFWNIVRGDLRWVGNRPLSPAQASTLTRDFERLWLAAPAGIVSLADAHGCLDECNDETCGHASYYAANASRRLNFLVLSRTFLRAAFIWPILGRRNATVRLPQFAGKPQV